MGRAMIKKRLKLMMEEVVFQICEQADKEISEKDAKALARAFDAQVDELAKAVDALPERPSKKKSN